MATTISGTDGLSPNALPFIVGQVSFFAMAAAPSGFLGCDGRVVSRTQYAQLFSAIGTNYGAGDGASTFAVPDLRGEFIRSADRGRGVDSGRVIGSVQGDANKAHKHPIRTTSWAGVASSNAQGWPNNENHNGFRTTDNNGLVTAGGDTQLIVPEGEAESRPRNVALLACIFAGV